ncbi:MAG: hypothetical protein AAF718_07750 [Pseudomonadota bacterium]
MEQVVGTRVARRRVFYIPGYDPYPPGRYRDLYRAESLKQALISGYRIEKKSDQGETGWTVRADIDGARVLTKFEVLVWEDLVPRSTSASIPRTYLALLKTVWIYVSTGTLRRLSWLAKGPVLAALYPVLLLLAQLAGAIALGAWLGGFISGLAVSAVAGLAALVGLTVDPSGWGLSLLGDLLFWGIFLPVLVVILRWFKAQDDKVFAYYLMQDYAYTASRRGAYPKEIEARLAAFRNRIEAARRDELDEILIVGHSSGAQLAVSLAADLLRAREAHPDDPTLSLLTLGQVIPMVSFLPNADRLRADLRYLSTAEEMAWLDVSAPEDACSFALAEPVAVSGVAPDKGQKWPIVISAAFSKTLKPEKLKKLRYRYFRLHFQYLCAFDQPNDYDYFKITAGPLILAQRFAGHTSSKSRIDVPASRFTSVVASSR